MSLCIAILGPTASGKSELAIAIAKKLDAEILSLDSTAVYRGFDIGTAKPPKGTQSEVPHHLIDILEPTDAFSAYDFVKRADNVLQDLEKRKTPPILVGGSFFYMKALQRGLYPVPSVPTGLIEELERKYYKEDSLDTESMHAELEKIDPASGERIHPNDGYRLLRALAIHTATGKKPSDLKPEPISEAQKRRRWLKYAIIHPRPVLHARVAERTRAMLSEGLLKEVERLQKQAPDARALQSVGYAECIRHLKGELPRQDLEREITEKTRQLAKRQMTWMRSDQELRFVDLGDVDRIVLEYNNLKFAKDAGENTAKTGNH